MKKLLALMALVLVAAGCEKMDDYEGTADTVAENVEKWAPMADKATGGWASVVGKIVGVVLPSVFAVNRFIVAKQRGNAIKEIHAKPGTPSADKQVVTTESLKAVQKLI